jgi:hypothetical protein
VPTLPVDFAAVRVAAFPELRMSTKRSKWNPIDDLHLGCAGKGMVAAWTATSSRISFEGEMELLAETQKLIGDGSVSRVNGDESSIHGSR